MTHADDAAAERWIAAHHRGAARVDVLAFFDRRPAVGPGDLLGRWRGAELPTGHPFDGLLAAHGWYGKEVLDPDTVHPLLFRGRRRAPRPVRPGPAPLPLLRRFPVLARGRPARVAFAAARPLLTARGPGARLRRIEHRGVVTAAIVYDALPVIDVFRRVTPDVLLGLMDMRGVPEPFFFLLTRERAPYRS
ncbi:MAG TPA: DUF4334 domain-containing protein [Geodermatophilus sp.]|nr:DUF4334 domain-containing protein [Geodermatophilus sp.]